METRLWVTGRAARAARWVAGLGRLALAVALLAALWIGTVNGVDRASRDADQRRASDRSAIANGFATSIGDWVDAGITEVTTLSRSIGATAGAGALDTIHTFFAQPRTFSRDVLVFSGTNVIAASDRYAELVGLHPKPCVRVDESGASVTDTRLDGLIAAAGGGGDPVVSQVFDVPGDCRPAIAVAAASGGVSIVVLGDVGDASSRLAAGSLIADTTKPNAAHGTDATLPSGGTRILLVTGDLAIEPRLGVVTVPPRVQTFLGGVNADGPHLTRYAVGGAGGAEVLAAFAPIRPNMSIVLEQDAAVFDIELQNRPSVIVASALTVVFAIVFALLTLFDIRRRRAHRRAEVTKNAFFSIAGHELRTPLTVIKGFAETLSNHWSALDDDRRRTLVERIVPQTRRLDRLVERLLIAASIQAETHTRPDMHPVDLGPALERVAERYRPEAPLHSFVVHAANDAPFALADQRAFDQVLEHLVDNAVKYSPAGGQIDLRVVTGRGHVSVIVEDEGVGLPSDHRHIFDKFVQGESVTKRVHDEGGVGLGLYIVRTLVEDMGGSVRAEPRADVGARFIVSLKASQDGSLRTTGSNGLVRSSQA